MTMNTNMRRIVGHVAKNIITITDTITITITTMTVEPVVRITGEDATN